MSINWVEDISRMHEHYKMDDRFNEFDPDTRFKFLDFRARFIEEELNELKHAIETKNAHEIVDSLIDICFVAIGTLDANNVNAHHAWDEVLRANMNKHPGVKEGRPNPLGLPDLIKMSDWVPPDHSKNYGWLWQLDLL